MQKVGELVVTLADSLAGNWVDWTVEKKVESTAEMSVEKLVD